MRKDTNKDLDLLFKEGLEGAAVKAPRGVWKAVSARLDSAAPAAAAAPRRSWLLWGAPAFAMAAAALATIFFVGNTEKTIIQSGEEIISVVDQPSGPVAEIVIPGSDRESEITDQVGGDKIKPVAKSPRAGFVPKEIQTPDQISVLPKNASVTPENVSVTPENVSVIPENVSVTPENVSVIPGSDRESEITDQVGDDKGVVDSEPEKESQEGEVAPAPEKPQAPWVDPFAQMEAEDAMQARKTSRKAAVKLGGIVGGNDAHFNSARPAFSSGLPSEGIQETSVSVYGIPVSLGLSARYHFAEKLSVSAGVNWSFLSRTFQGKYKTEEGQFTHNLQYVGVPVSVAYDVVDSRTLLFYCYAGGNVEKAISSQYFIYNVSASPLLSEKVPSLQYGVFGGIGVEFRVSDLLGLYVDPCVRYYFPGNQPKSIRTDRPLMFSFEAGLRFNL